MYKRALYDHAILGIYVCIYIDSVLTKMFLKTYQFLLLFHILLVIKFFKKITLFMQKAPKESGLYKIRKYDKRGSDPLIIFRKLNLSKTIFETYVHKYICIFSAGG